MRESLRYPPSSTGKATLTPAMGGASGRGQEGVDMTALSPDHSLPLLAPLHTACWADLSGCPGHVGPVRTGLCLLPRSPNFLERSGTWWGARRQSKHTYRTPTGVQLQHGCPRVPFSPHDPTSPPCLPDDGAFGCAWIRPVLASLGCPAATRSRPRGLSTGFGPKTSLSLKSSLGEGQHPWGQVPSAQVPETEGGRRQ